ncbi:hypothetical protein LZ30DRAFT_288423 [Colletotrichum cereale]|nr:hypothetical protein LZ30DRAFT_288423 [Colletotrichum cereale]
MARPDPHSTFPRVLPSPARLLLPSLAFLLLMAVPNDGLQYVPKAAAALPERLPGGRAYCLSQCSLPSPLDSWPTLHRQEVETSPATRATHSRCPPGRETACASPQESAPALQPDILHRDAWKGRPVHQSTVVLMIDWQISADRHCGGDRASTRWQPVIYTQETQEKRRE